MELSTSQYVTRSDLCLEGLFGFSEAKLWSIFLIVEDHVFVGSIIIS